jgi:hypothetical protein
MGAETNNEQFKLESLFNVKGKGTSFPPSHLALRTNSFKLRWSPAAAQA